MQLLANNASALLVGAISSVDTSLSVDPARSELFPIGNTANFVSPLDWFKITIEDASGNIEILKVGTRPSLSAVFSVLLRAQDGTTARSFSAGSIVEVRATAADLQTGANALVRSGGTASAMLGPLVLAGNAAAALDAVPKQQLDAVIAQVVAAGIGSVAGGVFYENKQNLLIDYTLTSGTNAHMVGPLTVASLKTLTIPTGFRLVVL